MNANVTIKIRSLVSEASKTFRVSNGIASGGLQWQYIVNCHIFYFADDLKIYTRYTLTVIRFHHTAKNLRAKSQLGQEAKITRPRII